MTQGGRWGEHDERGALNLVDAAATLRGLGSVRDGRVISLALPIESGKLGAAFPTRAPPMHFMTRDGGDFSDAASERHGFGFSDDVIMLPTHGTTHIDALSHVWQAGRMYNDFSAAEVSSRGAARCGIDKAGPIATRALFVDLAAHGGADTDRAIGVAELRAAVEAGGVAPEPGDALLVRTGWLAGFRRGEATTSRSCGLHHDCAAWIVEAGFALVAADNVAVEILPSQDPSCAVPLHIRLMRDAGIYLAELFDLEELATWRRASVMLVVAPLRIAGGVGSPITPVAIL